MGVIVVIVDLPTMCVTGIIDVYAFLCCFSIIIPSDTECPQPHKKKKQYDNCCLFDIFHYCHSFLGKIKASNLIDA